MAMLGQTVGFPVPVGGSGRIVQALVDRFTAAGGDMRLSCPVEQITVVAGRATGVRLASGEHLTANAVLADVAAPTLYRDLIGLAHLPARLAEDLDRFQWDAPTLKVNWALSAPVPWNAASARLAGTVHLGVDLNGLTRYTADLATQNIPEHPFLLFGQMTTSDASRSPTGTESARAYTHLPAGRDLHQGDIDRHIERVEARPRNPRPGFRDLVLARSVQGPRELQAANPNLVQGAVGGGTSAMHQQLIFRPVPGLGRAETPIDQLYLAGSSAHPGGGVHGGDGANAARAALLRSRRTGRARRRGVNLLFRIYSTPRRERP